MVTGTVLMETGDVPCRVTASDAQGMTIRIDRKVQTQGTLRLAFQHDGSVSGLVRLLAAVDGADEMQGGMEVQLRHLALHSTVGKALLRDFLTGVLEAPEVDDAAFKEGAGGWFYGFRATRPVASAPKKKATTAVIEADRREERVAVRVQVTIRIGERTFSCQAYNISSSGIYVLADEALPGVGTQVEVTYPVALHARPFSIRLYGAVVWEMPAMTSSRGGGLGIKLHRIDDGAGGQAWREYVQREVEFGGAVKAR